MNELIEKTLFQYATMGYEICHFVDRITIGHPEVDIHSLSIRKLSTYYIIHIYEDPKFILPLPLIAAMNIIRLDKHEVECSIYGTIPC